MMKRILIIDDDLINANLINNMLQKKDYVVFQLESALNCLKFIEENNIDLVLLDILMPDMTGIEALNMIREKYDQIALPVIMVTSRLEDSSVIESLNLGANDYIIKPINFDILYVRIATQLSISALSERLSDAKKFETLSSIIITYNHKINNPLAIIVGHLSRLARNENLDKNVKDSISISINASKRIADIIKDIEKIASKNKIEFENYTESTKMLKV